VTARSLSTSWLRRPVRLASPVTASLEVYAKIEEALDALPERERARPQRTEVGTATGELVWHFVGRDADRRAILRWLEENAHGLLVVTGKAGSGKSAILGNLLLYARARKDGTIAAGFPQDPWPASARLPEIDYSVHLAGATVRDVVAQIRASAFDEVAPVPARQPASDEERIDALLGALRRRERDLTVIADALDESQDPPQMAALFQRLGGLPRVRAVIGTRPSTAESPDLSEPADENLLDELGRDSRPYVAVQWISRNEIALAEYIRRRLAPLQADFPEAGQRFDEALKRVAALVTAPNPQTGEEREFLFAALAVHEILADPGLLRTEREGELAAMLRTDHRSLFGAAVRRLENTRPGSRAVLEALAFAQGRGLPRADRIWASVAKSLGDAEVHEADLDAVIEAAAPYIMLDAEQEQSVYRLAHRTFREFFLRGDTGPDGRSGQQPVVAALVDLVSTDLQDQEVAPALNPYLARHLAGHAADAGPQGWQVLGSRHDVLDLLNPYDLTAEALRSAEGFGGLPASVLGTIESAYLTGSATVADRPGLRELGTWRAMGRPPDAAHAKSSDAMRAAWGVRWARLDTHQPHVTLGHRDESVSAVVAFPGSGGNLVLSVGSDGGSQIWDPATGRVEVPPAQPEGGTGTRRSVAQFTDSDGRTLLATGGAGALHVWDPSGGRPARRVRIESAAWVSSIVQVPVSHGTALAVGDWSGAVHMVDPETGRALGRPRTGHEGPVWAVAAVRGSDIGPALLASAGEDGTIRIWALDRRRALRSLEGHTGRVWALAAYPGPAGTRLVSMGDDDVRIWDPDSGELLHRLTGSEGAVYAATVLESAGGPLLAAAGEDHAVRLWNLADVAAPPFGLIGHTDAVRSVAALTGPAGAQLLVTGGDDGTVRIWQPSSIQPVAEADAGDPGPVRAITVIDVGASLNLLAAAGDGGDIRLDDPRGVRPAQFIRSDHPGTVRAMATVATRDGTVWLAAAGDDGNIRLYDPEGVRPAKAIGSGHRQTVRAMTTVVSWDGVVWLATAGDGGVIRLDDPDGARPPREILTGHRETLRAMTTIGSRGAEWLVTAGDDETIRLDDPATARVRISRERAGPIRALTALFGAGGEPLLATAAHDGVVSIWDADTLAVRGPALVGHTEKVNALTFLGRPDGGGFLASAGDDRAVLLWDVATRRLLHRIPLGMRCLCLASMGDELAVGTDEGVVVLGLDPRAWSVRPGGGPVKDSESPDRASGRAAH
jgi:WD40 repeat protein